MHGAIDAFTTYRAARANRVTSTAGEVLVARRIRTDHRTILGAPPTK
jgi:hypothetical protein